MAVITTSAASAAPPSLLAKSPEDGFAGEGAGRLDLPRGIAADPGREGHVYIVDANNLRIDEFTAWGKFVKAWGWRVNAEDPQSELQTCTVLTGCLKGIAGSGPGQFKTPEAVAVDGSGMVWVMDVENGRVQRFDPTGGLGENEAVLLKSFGETGPTEAQFSGSTFAYINRIAACGTDDSLFVGKGELIQHFDSEGNFEGPAIAMPAGKVVAAIATDADCNLYVAFTGEAAVHEIARSAPYEALGEFEPEKSTERPNSLALDGAGNLYVSLAQEGFDGEPWRVQKYDTAGQCLTCGETGEGGKPGFNRSSDTTTVRGVAASGACHPAGEGDNAYVSRFSSGSPGRSYFSGYGIPDPEKCEPPPAAPVIAAQYATVVETRTAKIKANINPKFWAGAVGTTNYYAQWGPTACVEAEGWDAACVTDTAAPPGPALEAEAVNTPVSTTTIHLEGLEPGTSYSYRFVAVSDGGGPTVGGESMFTTFRVGDMPACANDATRSGTGAALPDCRAYELVSPLEKLGGDIIVLPEFTTALPTVLSQSSADGGRMAYGSYRAFGGAKSAPATSQYVAAREPGVGWTSHAISPPEGKGIYSTGKRFDNEFRAFSNDLCTSWVQTFAESPLAAGAPAGFSGLYRRTDEECGGSQYTALNTSAPEGISGEEFALELQGVSADEQSVIYLSKGLTTVGGSKDKWQLYGRRGATERMLCILPEGGGQITGSCTGGGTFVEVKANVGRNRRPSVQNAISTSGERVFWTATEKGPGKIYVREHPFSDGGDCSGPEAPCTFPVSEEAETLEGASGSRFQAASKDGSRALFVTKGTLYEYDLETKETTEIAGEVVGAILGASEDAKRVYFVSREARAPGAVAGQANLYFHSAEGSFQLIGAFEEGADLQLEAQSPVAPTPDLHTARVNAAGTRVALTAATPLTAYDNADSETGEADAEVYLYDSVSNELVCASCNPSGARPRGQVPEEGKGEVRAAGRLPVFQSILYGSRLLSPDGHRLFFLAADALTPRDTNEREDLYQWEAIGKGACTTVSVSYSPSNGGCVDLISSGQASIDVRFLDADESGSNVFFTTVSSLVSWDYGLVDVYDARVGGGLPGPAKPVRACEGEACQGPYSPPVDPTPASSTFYGAGNVTKSPSKSKKCGKPKVKRRGHCVKSKRHKKKHKRQAKPRAGRR
ncbi:MAG TPA: hypothetical protein VG898_07510 [Solirubrobacterales bacterium]|nr:hypothetical protein [Solirubrobacterales bacterium]